MTQEQYAADVINWLADLAVGAKANTRIVRCADCDEEVAYRHSVSTYDQSCMIKDEMITVAIHSIKLVANVAGFELHHRKLEKGDYYYDSFVSEDYFIFNGVKFADYTLRNPRRKTNERK